MRLAILFPAIVVAACSTDGEVSVMDDAGSGAVAHQLTPAQTASVQRGVLAALTYPDAVRFGQMAATTDGGLIFICGLYDGRIESGRQMSGLPFMGIFRGGGPEAAFEVMATGETDISENVAYELCRQRAGIRL